jgi:hypothetical protein
VFENKVLRRIFGRKRVKVTEARRKFHNDELHNLRWAWYMARVGEDRKVYRALVGKLEGKDPLGRPRRRWEVGIRMDLREAGRSRSSWFRIGAGGRLL